MKLIIEYEILVLKLENRLEKKNKQRTSQGKFGQSEWPRRRKDEALPIAIKKLKNIGLINYEPKKECAAVLYEHNEIDICAPWILQFGNISGK